VFAGDGGVRIVQLRHAEQMAQRRPDERAERRGDALRQRLNRKDVA